VDEAEVQGREDAVLGVTEAQAAQVALESTRVLAVLSLVAAGEGGEPDAEIRVHRHQAQLRHPLANHRIAPAMARRRALAHQLLEPRGQEGLVPGRQLRPRALLVQARDSVWLPA
jgi:hypothetical protein